MDRNTHHELHWFTNKAVRQKSEWVPFNAKSIFYDGQKTIGRNRSLKCQSQQKVQKTHTIKQRKYVDDM